MKCEFCDDIYLVLSIWVITFHSKTLQHVARMTRCSRNSENDWCSWNSEYNSCSWNSEINSCSQNIGGRFNVRPRFAIILGGESSMLNEIFAGFAFLIFSSIGKSPRVIISSFGGGSRGLIVQLYRLEVGILTFFYTFAWFFWVFEGEKVCKYHGTTKKHHQRYYC